MKVLSLNCQRGYTGGLEEFLRRVISNGEYDFLLLQEFYGKDVDFLKEIEFYKLLQTLNVEVGQLSQTIILYRSNFSLLEEDYEPFAKIRPDPVMGVKHSVFGSLVARFKTEFGNMLLGSVHLHSGMDHKVRAKQVEKIKEQTLRVRQPEDIIIFGGDCNFGFPGERSRAEKILAPQFICTTSTIGPTLDGRYSENVPHLPNRIARLLSFFGIATRLCTDHLFINAGDKRIENLKVRILPDRVSDHSPVELVF